MHQFSVFILLRQPEGEMNPSFRVTGKGMNSSILSFPSSHWKMWATNRFGKYASSLQNVCQCSCGNQEKTCRRNLHTRMQWSLVILFNTIHVCIQKVMFPNLTSWTFFFFCRKCVFATFGYTSWTQHRFPSHLTVCWWGGVEEVEEATAEQCTKCQDC